MESWQLALVVLLALLVGALIPILVLLAATLTVVRKQVLSTGKRLDDALDEIHATAARLNAVSRGVEGGEKQIRSLLDAVGGLTSTVETFNSAAKISAAVVAAVGPAVMAFTQSLNQPADEEPEAAETEDDGSAEVE